MTQEYRSRGGYEALTWNEAGVFNVQVIRPTTTNSSGNFLKSSDGLAGNIHTMLNEVVPDSSNYAYSNSAGPAASIRLAPAVTPVEKSGHRLRYQIKGDGTAGMTFRLKQGSTIIATWSHVTEPIIDTIYEYELSVAEASSITDYSILDIEFQGD